jgi:hypothetical protein
MTSGLPPVRAGAVAQPDQGLIDRIRRLETIVEEQQRRDMNRATVGQGGTFRGYFDNGQLAFTFGEDIDDGVRKVRMNWPSTGGVAFQVGPGNPNANEDEQFKLVDQSGNKVFATDGLAGYGAVVSAPHGADPGAGLGVWCGAGGYCRIHLFLQRRHILRSPCPQLCRRCYRNGRKTSCNRRAREFR